MCCTLCLKKGPTFKLSQNLIDYQNFCTAGERMKFAIKLIRRYLPKVWWYRCIGL